MENILFSFPFVLSTLYLYFPLPVLHFYEGLLLDVLEKSRLHFKETSSNFRPPKFDC